MPTLKSIRNNNILQFLKYAVVGVINTLLTLAVIVVCKDFFEINLWLSNAIGYVAGFINSFVWNKLWVFHSHNNVLMEAVKFIGGFLACYLLQLGATMFFNHVLGASQWTIYGFVISSYGLATVLGMIVYTLANYFYNRMVTFSAVKPAGAMGLENRGEEKEMA